jgi:hypothetical protein
MVTGLGRETILGWEDNLGEEGEVKKSIFFSSTYKELDVSCFCKNRKLTTS